VLLNNNLDFGDAFGMMRVVVLRLLVGNGLELLRIDHNGSFEFFVSDKSRPSFGFSNQQYLTIFPRVANILNILLELRLLLLPHFLQILADFFS